MELLGRLQAIDVVFAIVWAIAIGWGLQSGLVRQLGVLIGTYGANVVSGSVYHQVALFLSMAFGRQSVVLLEFFAYVGLFVVTFSLIGLIIVRAYPRVRLSSGFGGDNIGGAVVAAIWGVLLLISLLTMLRFYAGLPWTSQEALQQRVARQVELSQIAPVLEVVTAPLWQLLVPWFPSQVGARL